MNSYTPYQIAYLAHWLSLEGKAEESLKQTIASAKVDMNPHQIEAALFALESPLSQGVILADEVGLGKTIEASLVLGQKWAEHRRKLLLIVPATLRKQWSQELAEKFSLPTRILEAKNFNQARKQGVGNPFDVEIAFFQQAIVICSYEFAARKAAELQLIPWDLVVFDEAHKLRNIYKKEAKTAKKISDALISCKKVLLSATPLQNNLQELYGLVSVIDPLFFGDLDAFRTRYCKPRLEAAEFALLRSRLSRVCHRTLRRQVQKEGGINFTRRYSMTENFEPFANEQALYEGFSQYLQGENLAIKAEARHLVILVIRKILASSSFAVRGTLETMITRLENKLPITDALQDFDGLDDLLDENDTEESELIEPDLLKAEIDQLKAFKQLADSIEHNAKGDALLRVLDRAFEQTERMGGRRKAVIFTESVRTQAWLFEQLSKHGYQDQIVLLNGSNGDPVSNKIYRQWEGKHRHSSRISGSKTADMKAALVDKFREDATLMICTEAGAEGINLQFCSLLINYDLPWNPQRIEQRIGRVHRYGQKNDVVVVNFINQANLADKRVFELLNQKFKLFEGVFGASDEILGSIESGVDIERRIFEIYQKCRDDKQIEAEFDRLQEELKEQIEARNQEARRSLFEKLDADVIKQLNLTRAKTQEQLNDYQQRLLQLAHMTRPQARFEQSRFTLNGETYDVDWRQADESDAQFFRPHEGLGAGLIAESLQIETYPQTVSLQFQYCAHGAGQFSDLRNLIGHSGELVVEKLTYELSSQKMEYLLLAAVSEHGEALPQATIDCLLLQPALQLGETDLQQLEQLEQLLAQQLQQVKSQVDQDLERYYNEETEKLERWAEDRRFALDIRIKQLDAEIKEQRKAIRQLASLTEKRDAQRALKLRERERDEVMLNYYEQKKQIDLQEDELLNEIDEKLAMQEQRQRLFTIRWALTEGTST